MKYRSKLLGVGLGLLILAGSARAGIRTGGLEAFAGAVFPAQDSLNRSFCTGFGFTWPMASRTRVGVHFLHAELESRGQSESLLEGKLILTPFLVTIRQDIVLSSRFVLFFSGGGGVVFTSFREEVITIPEVTISQHIPNGPALHIAGGAAVFLLDRLAVFGQAGYLYRRARGTTTVRDMNLGVTGQEFTVDLSYLQAVAGLAYYF